MYLSQIKIGDSVIFNQHSYAYLGTMNIKGRDCYCFKMELKGKVWKKILYTNERDVSKHELKIIEDGKYQWETN